MVPLLLLGPALELIPSYRLLWTNRVDSPIPVVQKAPWQSNLMARGQMSNQRQLLRAVWRETE